MKKFLSLLLLILVGCSNPEPINIETMLIERDDVYWSIHKIVFEEMYDDLDNSIKSIIVNKPESTESRLLNKQIDLEVRKRLTQG